MVLRRKSEGLFVLVSSRLKEVESLFEEECVAEFEKLGKSTEKKALGLEGFKPG